MQSIDVVVAHIRGHVIFHMLSRWGGAFNIQSRFRLPKNRSMTAVSQHAPTAPIEDRNPFLSSSLQKRSTGVLGATIRMKHDTFIRPS
jgi:hypothetical protein